MIGFRRRGWRPKWTVDPAPCGAANCTPEHPTCMACIDAVMLFNFETRRPMSDWALLDEWQRESWRREVKE